MARKDSPMVTNVAAVAAGVPANIRRDFTKSTGFFSAYANDVQVQTTPWDMRLSFGEIGDIAPPQAGESPALNIRQIGELRISPQLAKMLTRIMQQQLKTYEDRFGQIPVPHD